MRSTGIFLSLFESIMILVITVISIYFYQPGQYIRLAHAKNQHNRSLIFYVYNTNNMNSSGSPP